MPSLIKKLSMNLKIIKYILIFIIAFAIQEISIASEFDKLKPEDILIMSLEEMMKIKIVTAGKTSQQVSDIPASAV